MNQLMKQLINKWIKWINLSTINSLIIELIHELLNEFMN